ncbi:MAG: hypothetical protein E4G74_02625 [Erysipelotrichales bacterium]|nr:MAG: hypothetical protein E4G74_02625 [Erysipelotrichales bacterium]
MTKFVLKKASIFEISENWKSHIAKEENFETLASAFKMYKDAKTKIHLCLSTSTVIYRDMVVPKTNPKYTAALVRNELINVLSLTPEYLIDYSILGETKENENKFSKVLATAILTTTLNEYIEFFKQIGIGISQVDVGLNALLKYLDFASLVPTEKNTLVVDVGLQNIRQYLFEKGQYSFYRNTKLNSNLELGIFPSIENYTENIEKMIQFALAQGQKTEIDEMILLGNKKVLPKLNKYLNARVTPVSRLLLRPKQLECDGLAYDSQYAYALGILFATRKKRKKDIDLLDGYNEYYKIKKHLMDPESLFRPTLIVFVAALVFLFSFKYYEGYQIDAETKSIQTYLKQPSVVSTMNEIALMRKNISEIKAISIEIDGIKKVLDSIPRFTQESVTQIYSVKPIGITIKAVNFSERAIKISAQSANSTLFYKYILALNDLNAFEEVTYITYRSVNGVFTCEITIVLKGGE